MYFCVGRSTSFFLTLLGTIYTISAFGVGVPPTPTICKSMIPGHHGEKPQASPPFCQILASNHTIINGGEIEVTLSVIDPEHTFKGFYLQAREIRKNNPIGTFSGPKSDVKVHSCGGIKGNAAHHSNPNGKKSITMTWKAPSNYDGTVLFTATCLQDFFKFWTQVKSSPVELRA